MQYTARPRTIRWQQQRMRMAGNDIKYRESFLEDILGWVKDNQDVKENYTEDLSPSACWKFVHEEIYDIAKKHFEAKANTPKASWMSPETFELLLAKQDKYEQ